MITKIFALAGRATFTVANPKGDRYTYRITRKEANERWPEAFFVSLLTGPDNESDYSYLGMLNPETCGVRLTGKSRYPEDSLPVKVVRWALGLVWGGKPEPEGYKIHHEGKCCRCGRLLTVPESIESGIGPECAKKMAA